MKWKCRDCGYSSGVGQCPHCGKKLFVCTNRESLIKDIFEYDNEGCNDGKEL